MSSLHTRLVSEGHAAIAKWKVFLNGELRTDVRHILLESEFGSLEWGLDPLAEFIRWAWFESGGGGAVTVPYFRHPETGVLHAGLITENRWNMGGETLCVIGGFVKPGQTHQQAADEEALEETGLELVGTLLHGVPANGNRLYFVADYREDKGLKAYASEVPFSRVKPAQDGLYVLEGGIVGAKRVDVLFLPWREAIRNTPDLIARGALAQLVADLL